MEEIKSTNPVENKKESLKIKVAKLKEELSEDEEFELKYKELKEKYSLPKLKRLCEDFDVKKGIDKDSDSLLREMRRVINEKIAAYLNLFETLINPTSPPVFVFSILRGMTDEDKKEMKAIYKTLSRTQLVIMRLDTIYEESSEAKFISDTFNIWQELKPTIIEIIKGFETNFEKDDSSKKSSYFD